MKTFYDNFDGKEAYLYTIRSEKVEADICEVGARINAIRVNGVDITLGFSSVSDYNKSGCYAGATIGRVANRIAGGKFTLDGKEYRLNLNDGNNHLHGGNSGFDKKFFTVKEERENTVTMEYVSSDGEENYPGKLKLTVKFTLNNNTLEIKFTAESDKDTLWCPTNHTYFNLDGEGKGDCRENILQINADYFTPVDDELIPTGERREVINSPFDFNLPKRIGEDFGNKLLRPTNGYDQNFILKGGFAAHAESKKTGIKMDVYTDMPCMQLYSGGQLKNVAGKSGIYNEWYGFCLEPQYCPNAINMRGFEKPILKKGEKKSRFINFKFHF